jgi:tetratricopeptide (TPR) repeat protein
MHHRFRPLLRALALATALASTAAAQNETRRGAQHFNNGDFTAARASLSAAVRSNERDAEALYWLGRVAVSEDKPGEAIDWLEKAIAVDANKADYHVWLGNALGLEAQRASKFKLIGIAKRTKSEFERALQLDPRNVPAREGLVQYYLAAPSIAGGSTSKARELAGEIARLNALHGHLATAYVAEKEKQNDAAERAYQAAVAAAPDSSVAYLGLGAFYQRIERWDDAFTTYDRLLKARPSETAALYQIGRAASLSGKQLERGEQLLKRYIADPPGDASVRQMSSAHYRLGAIYHRQGRKDLARAEYELALKANPRNADAKKAMKEL